MKRLIAGGAALLLALLLGYIVWGTVGENRDAKSGRISPQSFGPAQRQAFEVLRGKTRPVPVALQTRLRRARNSDVRTIWLNSAKYVPIDSGFWVANGPDETCIIQAQGDAVSCVPKPVLLRRGLALGVVNLGPPPDRKAEEFIVAGIVPNRIKAVEVQVGARTRLVTVRNNAYSLRAPRPIVVTRFSG